MWNQLKTPFAVIVFIFLCLLIYTKVAGPIPFSVTSVQTTKTNLFQTSGDGKATAIPDTATLSFGVTKTAATVEDAQQQTNTAINTILNSLKSSGVDTKDIKTTNYSVNPQYNYLAGNQNITGYTVLEQEELKVKPLDKVNTVLDLLTKNGANLVNQVTFGFDTQTQKDLENKARQEAVANAKQKAQSLANAAGIKLGRIINVEENFGQPQPVPLMAANNSLKLPDNTQTTVNPGENEVSVTVTLSYETY